MQTINQSQLRKFKDLYYKQIKTVPEIAEILGVSIDACYYFMRKNSLQRRTRSEEVRRRFLNSPDTFTIKTNLSIAEKELKTVGLMLYWCEGAKTDYPTTIDFANSDLYMLKTFLRFLRVIYSIKEDKIRVLLYCYSNQRPDYLVDFWSKELKIPKGQFTKPYIRHDFNPDKTGKMSKGMIHIRYSDKKLFELIKSEIVSFKTKYA